MQGNRYKTLIATSFFLNSYYYITAKYSMKGFLFLIFIIIYNITISFSQVSAPKYSNEFLNLGVGARALGMGTTQVSSVQDVTAGYWNPAGLLQIKEKYDIGFMHAEYFAGIAKYDYLGFATPIDSMSHLGFSLIRFGIDDIPDTRFLYDASGAINYNNIRFFSAVDYAFLISYARENQWVKGLNIGANFKIIRRVVGDFANAWGFGFDVGAHYKLKKWNFGLMARDITGTFNAWTHNTDLVRTVYQQTGNAIPTNSKEITLPRLILGVSRSFLITRKLECMPTMDLVINFDGKRNVLVKTNFTSFDPTVGLELNYAKIVFLRAGVRNIQQVENFEGKKYYSIQPDFGLGIAIYKFNIDYALTNIASQGEGLFSHIFSVRFAFSD